jgi:hypothetical protein
MTRWSKFTITFVAVWLVVIGFWEPESARAFDRPCLATAAVQTYKEGDSVPCSAGLDGVQRIDMDTLLAGERNPTSATTSYLAVRQEANLTVISTTSAVTLGGGAAGDTHLMGIQILTTLTGTCTIAGFSESGGAAQTFTIPAGSVGFKDFFGAINSAAPLVVTCSNVADDNLVLVLWRAL